MMLQIPTFKRWLGILAITSLACLSFSGCRWTSLGQNTSGVQLFQQGRYPEALQHFEAAKQSDPTNPDSYYNLASTYHKMATVNKDSKLFEQAEALYNQCLDIAPNHTDCNRGLAVLLVESNRPDSAFELMKRWAQKSPNLSEPRIELSRLYQEFGQNKVAEQYLDEALAMDPNNAKAWSAKGRMRETSNDLQQAVDNYQRSLAINSLQPELFQRIAAINVRLASNNLSGTPGSNGSSIIANGKSGSTSTANSTNTTTPRY